jgi:hypothetical protein
MIFNTGNKTIGRIAVTGIGIASVIHHVAIRKAEAAILFAGTGIAESGIKNKKAKKTSNPVIKPK